MENKIVFGRWEAITVVINMVCTKVFLNFPRTAAEQGATASGIFTLWVSILAMIVLIVLLRFYRNFEGMDLLKLGEMVFGATGRIITGVIILCIVIYLNVIYLREFAEYIKVIVLTYTPISFITTLFVLAMCISAYLGIEALVRFHALAVPVIATGYLIIIAAVLPYFNVNNLFPILGSGAEKIFVEGSLRVSIFSELIFLFLLVPFLKTNKNLKYAGIVSFITSTIFLLLSAIVFVGTIPYPSDLESFLPIYHLARLINFGRFFQRIESIFILIWISAALLYLSVCFYFIVHIFSGMFKLKHYKPLILPFGILVYSASLIPQNLITTVKLEVEFFRKYSFIIAFGLPLLVLVSAKLSGRKPQKEGK